MLFLNWFFTKFITKNALSMLVEQFLPQPINTEAIDTPYIFMNESYYYSVIRERHTLKSLFTI